MTYPRITLSALAGLVLLSGQVMAAGTTPSADGQTGGVFTPEQEARIGQVAADYLLAHPMKLIIFIISVILVAALLISIILKSAKNSSPLLIRLRAAGIRVGDAERLLAGGSFWQRQNTLMTEREIHFMKGLFRVVDMKRWYLCPQVRVADIVQLKGNIRSRSRQWWQLFRMVSQ